MDPITIIVLVALLFILFNVIRPTYGSRQTSSLLFVVLIVVLIVLLVRGGGL